MMYGLWHPEKGWWWSYMTVWATENRHIALAQCSMVRGGRMGGAPVDNGWKVRSLLNWEISEGPEKIASLEWQDDA